MKLALIGCGAMGKLVADRASSAGDEIGLTLTSLDALRNPEQLASLLRGHDAAIDFSVARAVLTNVEACARAAVPLVEGTTGWNAEESEARRIVLDHKGALVYGANFSIGVNLFYRIAAHAASLFKCVDQYAPFIEEQHHAHKRDVPSGTAIRLRDLMAPHFIADIPITSTRAGHIPGTHRIGFDSPADQVTLTHVARSREGYAAGALFAARWIVGREGVFGFSKLIDEVLESAANQDSGRHLRDRWFVTEEEFK